MSFLTAVVVLSVCCVGAGQDAKQKAMRQLEQELKDACRKHKVPSLAIAAVRSDEVLTTLCSGVRKRGTDNKVELTDRYPLGSNTKSMTATLAAIVVESGKIDWGTTISEVWPKLDDKYLHPRLRDVTLNDLLSHQSGMKTNFDGDEWGSFFKEKGSPSAERRRMLKLCMNQKPKYKRGEYHYSNLGYVVAAAMIENRAGENFETLMRRNVFAPLKMTSADFRTMKTAGKLASPLLWGHLKDGTPISPKVAGAENPSVYASAGTVHLAIADYAKYAQWHLRGKPEPLLSRQETFDHLHTGQVDMPNNGAKYGGGWILFDSGYGRAMQHMGSNTNTRALIWILPEKDLAAIACTNTDEPSSFPACDEMIAAMFKQYVK
jgi:CubicO group peptidase (beta-lactamase class C family)